jgi:Ca2+-binding EF-hand superfamily protein
VVIATEILDSFANFDADNDGKLSLEEVQALMPSITVEMFNELDANNDGYLTASCSLPKVEGEQQPAEGEGEQRRCRR